jgi:hypothetical protein
MIVRWTKPGNTDDKYNIQSIERETSVIAYWNKKDVGETVSDRAEVLSVIGLKVLINTMKLPKKNHQSRSHDFKQGLRILIRS